VLGVVTRVLASPKELCLDWRPIELVGLIGWFTCGPHVDILRIKEHLRLTLPLSENEESKDCLLWVRFRGAGGGALELDMANIFQFGG